MPLPLFDGIVYGPVLSRRLGRSLGVNLLPVGTKVCNMNCAYCQYGWTRGPLRSRGSGTGWPSAQAVQAAIEARLEAAASDDERIDRITIAGHGEPTLHPDFDEVIERICRVRNRIAPRVPVAILSNSMTAGKPEVRNGLTRLDERYMKLDAGDPFTCADINGSVASLIALADAPCALPSVVIQAMFVADAAGRIDNTSEVAVDLWLAIVATIRAERVHIYTIDRAPALPTLRPVGQRRLREIAERVRHAGIPADVFATPVRSFSLSAEKFADDSLDRHGLGSLRHQIGRQQACTTPGHGATYRQRGRNDPPSRRSDRDFEWRNPRSLVRPPLARCREPR